MRYIILSPAGRYNYATLAYSEERSIELFLTGIDHDWQYWQDKGYRCVKVNVTITSI